MKEKKEKKPNILFLMTDQQRHDQLGLTNGVLKTPSLDALAGDGVFFPRAYTSNPVCVPARAAIYSGRYPSQTGVHHNKLRLSPQECTFMAMLRDGGYHTAIVGKQHFNESTIERGYVYEDIVDTHGPAQVISPEALDDARQNNSYQRFLYDNGFRHSSELLEPIDDIVNHWKVDSRFHIDSYIGARGVEWLRERRPEAGCPWFLCVSFPGPHGPIDGHGLPQEMLYPPEDIDLPGTNVEDLMAKPEYYRRRDFSGGVSIYKHYAEEQIRAIRRAWYANISLIDEQVGAIVWTLKEIGEYENTMIVFCSDHGDFGCDLNSVDKGPFLLDVLMRVPLIIKPPTAVFKGKTESSLVSTVDLPATWLAAAGIPVPATMRSRDLSPYWSGAADMDDRDFVYMEAQRLRGIRSRRWKYVHYHGEEDGELYDLESDPCEQRNLWGAPEHRDVRERHANMLADQLIELAENMHVPW